MFASLQDLADVIAESYVCQRTEDGSCSLRVRRHPALDESWEALCFLSETERPLQTMSAQILENLLLPVAEADQQLTATVSGEEGWETLHVGFGHSVDETSSEEILKQALDFVSGAALSSFENPILHFASQSVAMPEM